MALALITRWANMIHALLKFWAFMILGVLPAVLLSLFVAATIADYRDSVWKADVDISGMPTPEQLCKANPEEFTAEERTRFCK